MIYKILIVRNTDLIGAFTSWAELEKAEKNGHFKYDYDIVTGEWKKEWLCADYNIIPEEFDKIIIHD